MDGRSILWPVLETFLTTYSTSHNTWPNLACDKRYHQAPRLQTILLRWIFACSAMTYFAFVDTCDLYSLQGCQFYFLPCVDHLQWPVIYSQQQLYLKFKCKQIIFNVRKWGPVTIFLVQIIEEHCFIDFYMYKQLDLLFYFFLSGMLKNRTVPSWYLITCCAACHMVCSI